MDGSRLAQLLQASQVPNTEQVKAVTADLQKNYYSKPESLILLIEIALTHNDGGIRQLAAVQALRYAPKQWEKTSREKKPLARAHLLNGALKESSEVIRHALARLIAGLIGLDADQGEEEEFLKQVLPLNNSDDVQSREVGSYILYELLEQSPAVFQDMRQLLQLFRTRIEDPDSKNVRINIAQAVGAVLPNIDPDEDPEALQAVQSFIPHIVNILKAAVEAEDEETFQKLFEVFHAYLACDSCFLAAHLQDLLRFMIALAANKEAGDDARVQAFSFLIQAVQFRRMKIQGMKEVAVELMVRAMSIITELDADDDEDDMSPARTAISLVSILANELHPRLVAVPMLEQFPTYATHPEPSYRMSAMLTLGNVAEGAPEFISTQLQTLLPTVINLLCDSDVQVRHAALVGLIHLAEEMADEMSSHHEQIISAVLQNLESASQGATDKRNIKIIRCACGALDTLGDGVDTKIMAQYGPNLVGPMIKLLDHEDCGVRGAAASAIGAIAASMKKGFQPYFEGAMKALGRFVTLKEADEEMDLRSATYDSLGRIALSVGPEAFQPYVMDLMKASEEALRLNSPRLKETSFILWSNLSKLYGTDFDHFLGGIFEGIFASLELEEEELDVPGVDPDQIADGTILGGRRIKLKAPRSEEDAVIATGGDEDWEDIEDLDDFNPVTAIALEQEVAIDTLGDVIANSCKGSHLETYVEKAIETIIPFTEHSYEGCRKNAISTLWRIFSRVFQVWEEATGNKWQPGLPCKFTPPPSILKISETLRQTTMEVWTNDSDRGVIAEINRNVAEVLKSTGPVVLTAKPVMMQELVSVLTSIITRSHPCQQDPGAEDEEQEIDASSSEYDWLIVDSALDVVVGLSAALGTQFGEMWKIFEKPVLKLVASTENVHRSSAIGVIAEIAKYTGDAISPFTDTLAQTLFRRLSDLDPLTKSNAAFALGLLIVNSNDTGTTVPMFPKIYEKLEGMLSMQTMRITDNVAGCLCRMMLKHSDNDFVAQALPAVVQVLPLTEDYEENEPVYQCIYKLYDESNPTVQQLTPQLLGIFQKVLGEPEDQLEQDTRQMVQRMVQALQR